MLKILLIGDFLSAIKELPLYHQMNGGIYIYDDEQILDLLRRTQELEKQKVMLTGVILIVMGIAFQALSHTMGGSDFKDFLSGLLLGLSIGEMLIGVYVIGKSLAGR